MPGNYQMHGWDEDSPVGCVVNLLVLIVMLVILLTVIGAGGGLGE